VAKEALHATISQIDGGGSAKGKFDCFELPCQVEQWFWFDELPFVCVLVFHVLFETVVLKLPGN
jgi:hypothetical protein